MSGTSWQRGRAVCRALPGHSQGVTAARHGRRRSGAGLCARHVPQEPTNRLSWGQLCRAGRPEATASPMAEPGSNERPRLLPDGGPHGAPCRREDPAAALLGGEARSAPLRREVPPPPPPPPQHLRQLDSQKYFIYINIFIIYNVIQKYRYTFIIFFNFTFFFFFFFP